jgi:glycosyltransferase involved in cell wall biosynthesis
MIRFSVIIPNLNSPTIGQTIESVKRQTYEPYQVIVVGMDQYNQIRETDLVHFDHSEIPLPPAKARNRGAALADGDVIVFIDADCIAQPNWLAILANCFADPKVSVVGGGVDFHSDNYWTLSDNISMFYEYLSMHPSGVKPQLPSLNLAILKQVFKDIGGFDERYPHPSSEDADLSFRLRQQGHRLYFEPSAVVLHKPPRNRMHDMLQHGYYQGMYSTKVDPRYASEPGLPKLLRTRFGVACFSPLLALGVTFRIFIKYPMLFRYWYTAPAILLSKLSWCLGAAARPKKTIWMQEP